MANIKSAQKRARQEIKRRALNTSLRSRYRTAVKKVLAAVRAGDKAAAEARFKEAVPEIDSIAGRGIVHANKAARHKSRLNEKIRAMQG